MKRKLISIKELEGKKKTHLSETHSERFGSSRTNFITSFPLPGIRRRTNRINRADESILNRTESNRVFKEIGYIEKRFPIEPPSNDGFLGN